MVARRLSRQQKRILAWLLWDYQRSRGTRTSDHYELIGVLAADKGNISRSLKTLEAREMIVIGRSPGGKARSLWLTAAGQIWAENVTGSCD